MARLERGLNSEDSAEDENLEPEVIVTSVAAPKLTEEEKTF